MNFTSKEFNNLQEMKLDEGVVHSESDFFYVPNSSKIIKIYHTKDSRYLINKKRIVENLIKFNKSADISELVIPEDFVYIDNEFKGILLPKINGINSSKYLDSNVPISKKIEVLKKIGIILEKVNKNNASFSDVHFDNFMVSNDNVFGIDTDGMKIFNERGVTNFYLYHLTSHNIDKYETDCYGIVYPSYNTDIYCYCMMILSFLSGNKNFYINDLDDFNSYLKYLKSNGFDECLINSLYTIYNPDIDNINPLNYLDSLCEDKVLIARKNFTR